MTRADWVLLNFFLGTALFCALVALFILSYVPFLLSLEGGIIFHIMGAVHNLLGGFCLIFAFPIWLFNGVFLLVEIFFWHKGFIFSRSVVAFLLSSVSVLSLFGSLFGSFIFVDS